MRAALRIPSGDLVIRKTDFYLNSADELSDTTNDSPFNQWAVGVGVAAAIAAYALYCFWTSKAILPGGRLRRVIPAARAVASGWLSLAAFVPLHWFWTASPASGATEDSTRSVLSQPRLRPAHPAKSS